MTIGSFFMDVDKKKEYGFEELATMFCNAGGDFIALTIMHNNDIEFGFLPVDCRLVKDNQYIRIIPKKESYIFPGCTEADVEMYAFLEEVLADAILTDFDKKLLKFTKTRYENMVNYYIVEADDEYNVICCATDTKDDSDTAAVTKLFSEYLKAANIHTFQGIQKAARIAKQLYQESIGSDEDPFVLTDGDFLY